MNGRLRIVTALVFGALLVGGSYYLSSKRATSASMPDPRVEAVVASAPPREYIEIEDADGDGVADWRQGLVFEEGWFTEAAASSTVPSTHTGQVAVDAVQRLMQSNMDGVFGESPENIVRASTLYYENLALDPFYTRSDVVISNDTSIVALRTYGNRMAEIVEQNMPSSVEDEVTILEKALQTGDPEALAELALIEQSYKAMHDATLATPVPAPYVSEHLDVLNTYNAMRIDLEGMQQAFDDPLYALARTQRYGEDLSGLYVALLNLYRKLTGEGIVWNRDDAVTRLVNKTIF